MTHHQLSLTFDYGISREQSCILCHLSAECEMCCVKCQAENKNGSCPGQLCSQPMRHHDGQRWDAWMHILENMLPELARFIAPELRKKYGINKLIKKMKRV